MTEADYILATNLAKLRIAEYALSGTLYMDTKSNSRKIAAIKAIRELIRQHELEIDDPGAKP